MHKIREFVATCISDSLCKSYIWIRESSRGQTLAEYALIFAALSLAVFAAYKSIGNSVVILGNGLNNDLTSA
jgi:Flp pilus assembly pilin Flp